MADGQFARVVFGSARLLTKVTARKRSAPAAYQNRKEADRAPFVGQLNLKGAVFVFKVLHLQVLLIVKDYSGWLYPNDRAAAIPGLQNCWSYHGETDRE